MYSSKEMKLMKRWAQAVLPLLAIVSVFALAACEGDQGPAGPAGVSGTTGCVQCHNDTNVISGKVIQWEESGHGSGESYVRGTRSSCAGCHSGNAFRQMIEAGSNPGAVAEGDPNPTRQDCRACHMIHAGEEYDSSDWALQSVAPVAFYADAGGTYDGGSANLCVNCHQPRRVIPEAVDGVISGISTHWGPHHGPQSSMLMGRVGAGSTVGAESGHYTMIEDTCVACHMGDEGSHTFEPDIDRCQTCHPGEESFDINMRQTNTAALIDQLGQLLLDAELIDQNNEDGHPIVTEAPENQAIALWNARRGHLADAATCAVVG
jgi:nitrate/TMAO reductase-like tetraheme cytochrome c subunit